MKIILAPMLVVLAIFISLAAATTHAAGVATVGVDAARLTTTHARQISDSGVGIVNEIQSARSALAAKDVRKAKQQVWKALGLAARLKAQSPTEELRYRIASAAKALEKSGKLDRKADLVPIYEQLDEVDYAHEEDIRTYLAKAEKGGKSSRAEVDDLLVSAGADVGYMEVDLGLDQVIRDLRRAHHALSQPAMRADTGKADASLQDALKNVHVVMGEASVVVNSEDLSDS